MVQIIIILSNGWISVNLNIRVCHLSSTNLFPEDLTGLSWWVVKRIIIRKNTNLTMHWVLAKDMELIFTISENIDFWEFKMVKHDSDDHILRIIYFCKILANGIIIITKTFNFFLIFVESTVGLV